MKESISRKALCGYLSLLRKTLTTPENLLPPHVVFMNSRSFYCHFAQCSCGGTTVEEILLAMESCIPLALTEESLSLFLKACEDSGTEERASSFFESSKADFLLLLRYAAEEEGRWLAVSTLCEGLRQKNQDPCYDGFHG